MLHALLLPKYIAPDNLTDVGYKTRRNLRDAIKSRLTDARYSFKGGMKSSYLWDAATLAHPCHVGMTWVDDMSDCTGE